MKNKIFSLSLNTLILALIVFLAFSQEAFAFYAKSVKVITLHEAYLLAVRRNDTIKAAKESYYRSTLLKWSAIGMLLPNIKLSYTDERMHTNAPSSIMSGLSGLSPIFLFFYPNTEYSFTLNQPILNIGAIPAYMSAKNDEAASKMDLNNISAETLYNVAVSYYTVLNDLSLIKADTKTFNEAKSHLELTKAKLTAGLAIITDLLQAKSQFYAAKQELISSKNALKSAKANLASLLGISRHFSVLTPPEPLIRKGFLRKYIISAYKNNPGLRSLKYAKKAADNETQYYESQYIPKINFTASYSSPSDNHFIPGGSVNYWIAGATLTMPIFQGGTRIISIEKARSVANQSLYNMIQAKRNLKAQVVSEFYNIGSLKSEVNSLMHEERFSSKNYMLVEEEYKAGVATSVDVVTALAELTRARHNLLSAKLNYYESVLGLKQLTGSFKRKLIALTADKFN